MVDALRRIHAALVPGGMLVDTQPVSPRPPVRASGRRLGTLDMREWRETIAAVDRASCPAFDGRLFHLVEERHFVVSDTFEGGAELVESVSGWRGTRISCALSQAVTPAAAPLTVDQDVRLRLLRAV